MATRGPAGAGLPKIWSNSALHNWRAIAANLGSSPYRKINGSTAVQYISHWNNWNNFCGANWHTT